MNSTTFFNFFKFRKKSVANIFLLNDHKTGFNLTHKIANVINCNTNLNIQVRTFYLFWNTYKATNKYIIIVRHPKEIIISAYLYHKKCSEEWSLKQGGDYYGKKRVKQYFSTEAIAKNKKYLEKAKTFSTPIAYQEKLNTLSQNEGIIYEMNSVSNLTIKGMYNLVHYHQPNTIVVKYEDLVFNHDNSIHELCDFLKVKPRKIKKIIEKSLEHNLLVQKKNNQITAHTTNRAVAKDRYKQYWNETIEAEFNRLFPADLLSKLNYE